MIVSLGSINADIAVRLRQELPPSGLVLAEHPLRTSGGKAANVAVFASRLGTSARLIGGVGDDDFAEQALRGPRQAGVDIQFVRRVAAPTGLAMVMVRPDGGKTIVLVLGANDELRPHWAQLVADATSVDEPSVLVVDLEMSPALVADAVRAGRSRGMAVVVDPSPASRVDDELIASADHLTPNHDEARDLTRIDTSSERGAVRAAAALRSRGCGAAYVKLPHGGCAVAWEGGERVLSAPPDIAVVDSTGAGDAFAGGVAWAHLQGFDPPTAAVAGVAAASCAVGRYGAQESYPTIEQFRSMRRRVHLEPAGVRPR